MPLLNGLLTQSLGSGVYPPGQPGGAGGAGGPAAPGAGAGWEIKVLAAPDFHQLLAVIPNKMITTLQFVKQLDDTGSGTLTLNMDDPWWGPGWSYVPAGSPSTDSYFIVGTPAAPDPVNPGDTFIWSGQAHTVFTVTSVSSPSSGFVNVSFSPPASSAMTGGHVTSLNNATLPNGQPPHYLLDWEHQWQVWQDGVPRFEFLGETVTEQLVDDSEQRIVTITGPGMLATLGWAMVAPNGFPGLITYKTDALQDGFDEIDESGNLILDTTLWNASSGSGVTLNPAGTCQLACTSGGTYLGSTAWDATNTLLSAQVTPASLISDIGEPDVGMDGSEVTQMYIQSLKNPNYYVGIGLSATAFYVFFQGPEGYFTHVIASAATYETVGSNTGNYDYWQISEANNAGAGNSSPEGPGTFYVWTSPDGQNWTKQATIAHDWDATSCAVYFSAQYDVANKAIATVTGLNSNVVTSSLGGPSYYQEPIIGGVYLNQLELAQARGTIPFITTGQLSAATDSYLNPWNDANNVQLTNGTDLLTLLQGQASMVNASYIMQPGCLLQIGIPETNQITLGTDRSNQVIFRDGMDNTSRVRTRARNQIANLYAVINQDSRTVTALDSTSSSEYGQREAWLQAAVQVTQLDLDTVASAAVQENADEVLSWTLQVAPYRPGRTIFTGFDVGDWVGLERPDFSAVDKVQVTAIAVSVAADGSETHELTLVSYMAWLQEQLTWIATKMGGGFVSTNGTTAVAGNGALTAQEPTVFAPTFDGLGGVSAGGPTGAGGAPLVYDPVTGTWLAAGQVNSDTGVGVPAIVNGPSGQVVITGGALAVTTPSAAPGDVGTATPGTGVSTTPTGTIITDATNTTRLVIGNQADGTYTTQAFNGPAPGIPDTPTVTGTLNGLLVTWDGLLGGVAPLTDFLVTEVHVSTLSGFTPTVATLQGSVVSAATFPVAGLTVGATYYVKLLAINDSGIAGTPSAQATGVPTSLSASLIGHLGTLNANPYFSGGDGSGWTGFNGTFSVTSSPPANCPLPDAGFFTITTAGVGASAEESAAGGFGAFAVAPNTAYLVTAWVYTTQTTVKLGFDWQTSARVYISTSTQTITVPASTWTLVTTVQTSAATGYWAYPRLSPTDGSGNSIYFTSVVCLQQVPGALVQAGTITATQIAANTITAAQIAANTITASQIAANTITAAQIAANTITASQVAAGIVLAGIVDGTTVNAETYTAYGTQGEVLVYAGIPASGNLIGSWAAAPGTDSYGNTYPSGLLIADESGSAVQLVGNANVAFDMTTTMAGSLESAMALSSVDTNQVLPAILASLVLGTIGSTGKQATALTSPIGSGTGSAMVLEAQNDAGTDVPVINFGTTSTPDGGDTVIFTPILAISPYALLLYSGTGGQVTVTKTSGSGTISTGGSATVKAETWGSGGGGGTAASFGAASAGAGEYACEPALACGATVAYVVGAVGTGGVNGGAASNNGASSTITGTSATVTAHGGGKGSSTNSPGNGGSGSGNSVHHSGGDGTSPNTNDTGGAGGGSSGGTSSAGRDGQPPGGSGDGSGAGGTAPAGGGAGGPGGRNGLNGANGNGPGGGGGGSGAGANGGNGGNGQVKVTYNTGNPLIIFSVATASGTDQFGNAYVAGVMSPALVGIQAGTTATPEVWHYVGGAVALGTTFGSGWSNAGSGNANLAFKLLAEKNLVLIRGYVTNGTASNGANIFTLPTAYRPASQQIFACVEQTTYGNSLVVQTNGAVAMYNAAGSGNYAIDALVSLDI